MAPALRFNSAIWQTSAQIERAQGKPFIKAQTNARARPLASFLSDAQQAVAAQIHLPPGYTISWGGSFQDLQKGMAQLSTVVPVALLMFGSARLAEWAFSRSNETTSDVSVLIGHSACHPQRAGRVLLLIAIRYQSRTMSPGQTLLAALAFACWSLIALGLWTVKRYL
ncbi:efflux RND transporter permease subunit [Bradyrhizobium sp. USDA 3364]